MDLSTGWPKSDIHTCISIYPWISISTATLVIAGKTVWSMPERRECELLLQKERYVNPLTCVFTFKTGQMSVRAVSTSLKTLRLRDSWADVDETLYSMDRANKPPRSWILNFGPCAVLDLPRWKEMTYRDRLLIFLVCILHNVRAM